MSMVSEYGSMPSVVQNKGEEVERAAAVGPGHPEIWIDEQCAAKARASFDEPT
ncbi:hypothetical protein [Pseudoxanthomonas mexicana]